MEMSVFDTLKVFLKELFLKSLQMTKKHEKFPRVKEFPVNC